MQKQKQAALKKEVDEDDEPGYFLRDLKDQPFQNSPFFSNHQAELTL